ncbi:hypothetical protein [Arenimonas sp.]|uniref:hypothetical protein n=1 Tax=Arenimonas sp. TaxID=1872635 RepID=UPI0035B013F2
MIYTSIRSSLLWFVVAVILTTFVVNAFGFASPLVASARYGEHAAKHSRDLLVAGQFLVPWLSISFILPAIYLARALPTKAAKYICICLGFLLPASYFAEHYGPTIFELIGVALRTLALVAYALLLRTAISPQDVA